MHDYAEIYTPSREGGAQGIVPVWPTVNPPAAIQEEATTPRPPTPPLHRFPSWEAKIYQVKIADDDDDNDGRGEGNDSAITVFLTNSREIEK